ncbi:HoxN/HupN/NixA family nickel/cobalt transporter [soil metagenome]
METAPADVLPGTRLQRIGAALTREEWKHAAGLASVIVGLHLIGFVTLFAFVVPQHFSLGSKTFGIGLGLTAYTLGLRHAFDADHISAIDNTTRKLMSEGKRPLSVGFYFSLGHSTVVFVAALLIAAGVQALGGQVESDGSTLHTVTGLVGTTVSGTFLYVIGILNLAVLTGILRVFRRMKLGEYDERELEEQLNSRGLMNRFYGRATRAVRKPWHMYPVGLLFGLGFDTATEVTLLFVAAGAASSGLPFYAILCLPVLFAAGMSLLDTIDGSFMNFAYGWAFSNPVRKVFYNIAITGLSVVVALMVGTIELLAILSDRLSLSGGLWDIVSTVDLNSVGLLIVGLFIVTWVGALAIWRVGRFEERWVAEPDNPPRVCPAA